MTEEYRRELLQSYPDIREIWLIGSRANGTARADSDWDYLVFGNPELADRLAADCSIHRPSIDILVVYDEDNFRKPWTDGANEKMGSLSEWEFKRLTETTASYRATKRMENESFNVQGSTGKAVRVWPEPQSMSGVAMPAPTVTATEGRNMTRGRDEPEPWEEFRGKPNTEAILPQKASIVSRLVDSALDTPLGCWLRGLLARTHKNVAVVALANKLARMIWAVFTYGRIFSPAHAVGTRTSWCERRRMKD